MAHRRRLPPKPPRSWTRTRHNVPILHPGEKDYPLKPGQMLYHGSNDPIRKLHDGAFLSPYTAIARGYARNWRSGESDNFRDNLGFVSRFLVQRLPRLVMFDTDKHMESYCGWAYFIHDADLWPKMHNGRRAYVLSQIAPPDCDGWIVSDYEIVLWKPHQFVTYWGMREWPWNTAPHIGAPRPKKPKTTLEGLGDVREADAASYEDYDFDAAPDGPFEPYGPIPQSLLQNTPWGDE